MKVFLFFTMLVILMRSVRELPLWQAIAILVVTLVVLGLGGRRR